MKLLTTLFGRRGVLVLVGLALLALAIWFAGPYLAFADYKPLESVAGRIIAILVAALAASLAVQLRARRDSRAGEKLMSDMAAQKDAPPAAGAARGADGARGPDAAQLRQRFDAAIAALRQSKRASLYELPWYIVIGPPGSGKTTAIVNSGLDFPLAQQFGKEALRGVGGTRNCDWWFTDRAVLLDTAGRYTTQDSDASADAAGWREFLALLRKHRGRRPINGVLVAMSVTDLMGGAEGDWRAHVGAIRQRLAELDRELGIALPAYLVLTKCDLLAGFTECFDDLGQDGRAQVWGVTFPLELSRSGEAATRLGAELDLLAERLQARCLARLADERDVQRRAAIFAFPRQLAGLRTVLESFVRETFAGSELAGRVLLRGVYLTSGTQEGTPVDRMLGALARTFGLALQAPPAQPGRGKAYFIERLLGEVVFAESGLAGVNRRVQARQAILSGAAYAAVLAITVLGLAWMATSYGRNAAYLAEVSAAAVPLATLPPPGREAGLAGALPRLDALREVVLAAERHRGAVPLAMRAGLYQGRSVGNAARDAYTAELNGALLPAAAVRLGARLDALASEPDRLYEYLKAYLMLGQPQRLDPQLVALIGSVEWRTAFADDPVTRERVETHFAALVQDPSRVQPAQLDAELVARARTSLRQASLPVLMYSRLRLAHAADADGAIDLGEQLGLGAEDVFVRRSGRSLAEKLSALYTRRTFDEVSTTGRLELVREFLGETWVLGEGVGSMADAPRLAREVMQLYEQDYIRAWEALLGDLQLRPTTNAQQLAEVMGLLASPASPLKRLLVLVEAETNLLRPANPADPQAAAQGAVASRVGAIEAMFPGGAPSDRPGTLVTRRFEPLHRLVQGPPGGAPIDLTLQQLGDIQRRLAAMGGGLGEGSALEALTSAGQADAMAQLQLASRQLPQPIAGLVAQLGSRGESVAAGQARSELLNRYRTQVLAECRQLIAGRYPFAAQSANDVALADFGRLFGHGGVFDTFFKESLAPLVDTTRSPWRWRQGAGAIGGSAALLAQFQAVERIRRVWFRPGGQTPQISFTMAPEFLDAAATKLSVEVDGQTLEYRHGPPRGVAMTWPGPAPGLAAFRFEERGAPGPNRTYRGPWALFRMLDEASVQPQSDLRYLVALTGGARAARVVLEATSVRNPFGSGELRRFRCEM